MTKPLALSALVLAAAATFAAPASAALPCDGMTIPHCLKPSLDRVGDRVRDVRDDVVCPLGVC